MGRIDPQSWKADIPAFKEKAAAFVNGEVPKGEFKGFSGFYGSYAQHDGKTLMLRLRMTAGRATKAKLAFVADSIRKYDVKLAKLTTCQAIQLHNLDVDAAAAIMESALDVGIVTLGGGGDFPRNVMCSPLSGVQKGENFDVLPWAEEAADYLMTLVKAEKMPRKLKVCFSNSPENVPHATFRDLGFVSRPDGLFDVYSAGGLGNNAKFGVKVAEGIDPHKILYYIKAMWLTFRTYGNYENRGKARTRYMQDACGGPEAYKKAYLEKLDEVFASGEMLDTDVEPQYIAKKGTGSFEHKRAIAQKQEGLYAVMYHPVGGEPDMETFCALSDAVQGIDAAELRIGPDGTAYIINLNAEEAQQIIDLTDKDSAQTAFEYSCSCIGSTICQVGVRDSNGTLHKAVAAVREAGIPDGALPVIHISGCPSSCGTHQIGKLGFRGAAKPVDGKPQSAFMLFVGGNDYQGQETMGREVGTVLETKVPDFLVELGRKVAAEGGSYDEWIKANPDGVEKLAKEGGYI